jgi:hypothetical protein
MAPMQHLAPASVTVVPAASIGLERDASNFDFRVVTLLVVLVTRQDLLKEYLDDGKQKDARNVPLAVGDSTKWKTLRTLFDPDMLGQMFYLFELRKTRTAARDLRIVFQTMINLEQYSDDTCPDDFFVKAIVNYSGQQTAELNPAGVADDAGSEN